jgi:Protein of unknown function (DUF1579)
MSMKVKTSALCVLFLLGVFAQSSLSSAADATLPQSPDELIKAMSKVGKPGPEHAKLKPLAGSWDYTAKFWLDPNQPPLTSKGTLERKLILGGRFLEERAEGIGFDGEPGFEHLGLIGYDSAQKKYTSNWACSMGTGTCTGVGSADSSGKKFTFQTEAFCPLMEKVMKGREVIRVESDDTVVIESYINHDGREVKMMELVETRKK